MITLYGFGPAMGLPEISPFVTKAHILLQIAGLPFETNTNDSGFLKAPKGKLPYIRDGSAVVSDSTFIRFHIEKKYGFDFDRGLSAAEKAMAWALERMCEEHLYWLISDVRWLDEANFRAGPAQIFQSLPAPVRPVIRRLARRTMRRTLRLQGLGRHDAPSKLELAKRDFCAISDLLADKPFLFGDEPRGVDASVGAFVIAALAEATVAPLRDVAESKRNLVAYGERILERFFPQCGLRARQSLLVRETAG
jgi:glutathione S-transferase